MAETVKKSRIVSDTDDNLEEALMEEFNLRLKSCMSQDDLQNPDDDEDENRHPHHQNHYDNVEVVKSNGDINRAASNDFIRIEKENYYEEAPWLTKNGMSEAKHEDTHFHHYDDIVTHSNGRHDDDDVGNQEVIYENLVAPNSNQKTDIVLTPSLDQYVDMTVKSPAVSPPPPPDNYEVMAPPEGEENTSGVAALLLVSSPHSSDDLCDSAKETETTKSVKDRMLLSTDATPCLLFSQTVTSPMLTPSEENIDFLKGFSRESTQNSSESSPSLVQEVQPAVTALDESIKSENIYENSEFLKQPPDEVIYENLKTAVPDVVDSIYENLRDLKNLNGKKDENLKDRGDAIYQNLEELNKSHDEDVVLFDEGIEHKEDQKSEDLISEDLASESIGDDAVVENGVPDFDIDTVPPRIVESLKSQFSGVNTSPSITNDKKEIEDAIDLKFVDITKQINKFERNEESDDDSTQVTETYVETTTFESNSSSDKALKKKKSKKSRKEEKENISVSRSSATTTNTNSQEFSYNVNVKNLCRSFGDLTKIVEDKGAATLCGRRSKSCADNRARAKSLSDVTPPKALLPPNKTIENVFSGVSVRALREKFRAVSSATRTDGGASAKPKSSFNKFDALQKKNVLHVRSTDSSKAQEKFNGAQVVDTSNCKACDKAVFQMEQVKAEKAIWHKNCFRCKECNKQLTVDTYQSHEGTVYCKPHFRSLFAPKVVDDEPSPKPRKHELIIRENQPAELPPDVVRASDKPDLGLEELQSLNVKERFQVFEHHQTSVESSETERAGVNVKRSPSILSKLARFQAKGMDIGVTDDALNGIPIEESSSEAEEEDDNGEIDGEDADLVRAKRVQKEKPFHFTGMSDVKSKWEQGEQQTSRDERREERKQEIQSIRNKLFMGKQGKMKEAYQQAVMESESCTNIRREQPTEVLDTKSLKERFEKGELIKEADGLANKDKEEDAEVFESEISKKSRSLFLELDANASKPPQITPLPTPKLDVKNAREAYLAKTSTEDVVKSSAEQTEDVQVSTTAIQQRFKFFEAYKEPEKEKRQFRITPPREGQVKAPTPDREVYRDPEVIRSEEIIEDSVIAKQSHTATKMLSKFRQMEENLAKEPTPQGLKPLKRFTPPPEPTRPESSSEAESGSEEESEDEDETDREKILDEDLLEAQKAARAKQLRAKFERWEASELKKEQNNSAVNIAEEFGEDQSQIESTRTLRARFESMRDTSNETRAPRVKVNRFVEFPSVTETCESCRGTVYPLEKISVHGHVYHKRCFKCMECNCVLRMDSYSYNQGLLYCMPHFKRLFISKGNYDTGFGLGQHKGKWTTNGSAQVA